MSLYLIVWLAMCLILVKDVLANTSDKWKHLEFEICFAVLASMLLFRYGQGTDYYGYMQIYRLMPDQEIDITVYGSIHGEFGWLLWANIFRVLNAPYEVYLASVSLVQIVGLHRFASIYNIRNVVTTLWIYPYLYLSYCYSGIRQGIVLAIFLGFMLPLLEQPGWRNIVNYYALAILMMQCHSSALVLFALPIVCRIRVRVLEILAIVAWLCGMAIGLPAVQNWIIATDFGPLDYYFGSGDFAVTPSWFAIIERLIFAVIVVVLYRWLQKAGEDQHRLDIWYRCWLVSFIIYGGLCWHGYLAARFGAATRYVEILIICCALLRLDSIRQRLVASMVVIYTGGMLLSNLNTYCIQGLYNNTVTAWNYPYVSIWNKDERFETSSLNAEAAEFLYASTQEEAAAFDFAWLQSKDTITE